MKWFIILPVILLFIAALITAQEDETETSTLTLSIAGETCALALDPDSLGVHSLSEAARPPETTPEVTPDPETTPEPTADWLPDLPTYTLSDDCETIEPLLTVASNGTLWLALLKDDADDWLPLDALEDDPHPPQLDARGRYFGCAIPDEGAQTCYVLVTLEEMDYLVAVPLWVGDAYFAPAPTEAPTDGVMTEETQGPSGQDNQPLPVRPNQTPQPPPTDEKPPGGGVG